MTSGLRKNEQIVTEEAQTDGANFWFGQEEGERRSSKEECSPGTAEVQT